MPRVGSKSRVCGRPSSPPRSSRLCARSAAAHSTTPRAQLRSYPADASFVKCTARKARLSRRFPAG
eukprot:2465145-Pleurochrysis_carterae.AAC.1